MEMLQNYGLEILMTIITALTSFVGITIKNAYTKYVDTQTKKEIVKSTVCYIEQVYYAMNGEDKLAKAKEKALEWLNQKGLKISETELEILIESAVNGLKGE